MKLTILINQILVLFIIIFIGYIIRKKKIINNEIKKGFSRLLIEITMPCLVITSILNINLNKEIITNIGFMIIISFLSYLFVIILSSFITQKINCSPAKKNVFKFLLIFGNVGYMGIPIVSAIFPAEAIVYTIINNILFNIFLWTYGILVFNMEDKTNKKIQWRKFINHGTVALTIGFILLITKIQLGPIRGALDYIAGMTFPLSMLIIGSSLTNIKLINIIKDKILYYVLFLKLFIIPLAAIFILNLFSLPEMVTDISIIMLAMPAGATSVIFAEKYEGDDKFASEGIFFTTLLSLISVPIIIWLI